MLEAYRLGAFPMGDARGRIDWFSPDPRCIIDISAPRFSRSLRKVVARGEFEVRVDTCFAEVMRACADREDGTWISPTIHRVYQALHTQGHAHSVECWKNGALAGGLYGVALGGAFFGESMFHRITDASKVAFVALVERLRSRGFELLDAQWITPHLATLGAIEIPRDEYLARLERALGRACHFADEKPSG